MSASIIGIGIYGIFELKKMRQSTQTLYADRVFPLEQLTRSQYNYSFNILITAQRLSVHNINYREGIKTINVSEKVIAADWRAYLQTYLTPQERILAKQATLLMQQSRITIEQLKDVLKKDEPKVTDAFLYQKLYPTVNPVIHKINQLISLQVRVGSEIYTNSQEDYNNAVIKFIVLIALSLIFAIAFSYSLIQNVRQLISDLKGSKEKYQSLLVHAGDPVFLLNKAGFFIEVNGSMCQLLGYTEKELLDMHIAKLFTPEQLAEQPLQFELLEKNKALLLEKEWLRKDGVTIAVEINTRVFEGIGYLAIARDITERIRVEKALRESERKYRNIFDNVQDVYYQANLEGIILDLSPSIIRHTGYTREELIGTKTADMYCNPEDWNRVIKKIMENGEITDYEVSLKSKTGDEVLASLNVRLIHGADGRPSHLDGSLRNITERKRIENELARHKEQLAIFVEYSPASLAMFDTNMSYIATSKRWMYENNIYGQNLIGRSHYEVFPNVPQHLKDGHLRCLRGAIEKNEEESFVNPDGRLEWIRWETKPWFKASGKIGGIIMLTEPITERKEAEQQLRLAYEQSKKQLDFITDLIWKQSHILRGPLANLKGLSLIVQKDPNDMDTLKYFMTELERMDRVLREMAEDTAKNIIS
jgi:PAS domain S-box-containing protein